MLQHSTVIIASLLVLMVQGQHKPNEKWFPYAPNEADANPEVEFKNVPKELQDSKHGIQMGVLSPKCDNGKINLTLDWDESPSDYTCFGKPYVPNPNLSADESHDLIPKKFRALHFCMDTPIEYNETIPSFGYHRPIWAKYGEYKYLPKQRWLHNLEHGAVVMLYHPCANKNEVKLLKHLVTNCLYRHVITPYAQLPADRPLALVTWGTRLLMSKVDKGVVIDYIVKNALNGPEKVYKDGQFVENLLAAAKEVSDKADSNICANFANSMK